MGQFQQTWQNASLVEIGPMVLEKKIEMWKVNDNDHNGQIVIRNGELKNVEEGAKPLTPYSDTSEHLLSTGIKLQLTWCLPPLSIGNDLINMQDGQCW